MYWLALAIMSAIVAAIFAAVVRKRMDLLAMPLLAAGIMGYLYIVAPLRGLADGAVWAYVTPYQAAWAILFPALALAWFCAGWFSTAPKQVPPGVSAPDVSRSEKEALARLYRGGLMLAAAALGLWGYFLAFSGGAATFYGAVHGQAGRWTDTTAWVYSGIHLAYPALAFMLVSLLRGKVKSRLAWGPAIGLAAVLLVHAVLIAGRGPFFQTTATLAAAAMLATRKRPPVHVAMAGLAGIAAVILLLVGCREAIHLGTSLEDLRETDFHDPVAITGHEVSGNEFVYHTAVLTTVDRLQQHGWGERYLWHLLLHPIPRLWWPSKPYYKSGEGTDTITGDDITRVMGWRVAVGAAPGLAADWYREWGILSAIAWAVLGAAFGWAYTRATKPYASPMAMVVYALIVGRGLHLIGQGFLTFAENILIMLVPAYLFYWLYVRWPRDVRSPSGVEAAAPRIAKCLLRDTRPVRSRSSVEAQPKEATR